MDTSTRIIQSRKGLARGLGLARKQEAEGGCGVVGAACTEPIAGRHFLSALLQMKNRGNGKGGGIAALGLSAKRLGVSPEILREDYLLQVAYLDPTSTKTVEDECIHPCLNIHSASWLETVEDFRTIPKLEVKPPDVRRYFCRVKEDLLTKFMHDNGLLDRSAAEDEFMYQNSYALNKKFYASLGEKKAFVLSYGKDMMVLKIVGWGDQVIRYYKLEDFPAHVWIGHHRYPTKGRVWHPGGAHPFVGVHEALVHNGDFSNYHSICEYLAQRNVYPLFLTDTEVAAYLFDLYRRVYGYPLEYLIEAMAPTTERDFHMLPQAKRLIYREIQTTHIHGSPDGPWFFIVGRSESGGRQLHLLGITDTSMLRPQVFALQEGEAKIGLIASERQAIDACLRSIATEDPRFAAKADLYWNARGGSHTDGGAFVFTLDRQSEIPRLKCFDKFGREIIVSSQELETTSSSTASKSVLGTFRQQLKDLTGTDSMQEFLEATRNALEGQPSEKLKSYSGLMWLLDSLHRSGSVHRGRVRMEIEAQLNAILRSFPKIAVTTSSPFVLVNFANIHDLTRPMAEEKLLLDVSEFEAEGDNSAAAAIVSAYQLGWKHVISFDWRGQRFCGSGLGANSQGFRIDVFGNPGDYLGSGLDGAEIYVHASAQDQVAQIMKAGKLVIYGDVGQTFMYGAKGGDAYVLGNAAGRPLINAVGRPRVVINGTCLDYLAESFMAGDSLNGGGFAIVNGIRFGSDGQIYPLDEPYAGSNLFSLASGGAIYLRDPIGKVGMDQLNGGRLVGMNQRDWEVITPYLRENEGRFGISVEDLLRVDGELVDFSRVYRKVEPIPLETLGAAHVDG